MGESQATATPAGKTGDSATHAYMAERALYNQSQAHMNSARARNRDSVCRCLRTACSQASPYATCPQVSLTIHKQPTDRSERTDDLWHSLFVDQRQPRNPRHQPDYRAKKLKQLTVPGRLTPDLMALLQHSAPSVEELTVTVLDSCNDR